MADGEAGEYPPADSGPAPQVLAENRLSGGATPPKEPGWYPVRSNPNEQTYWDGRDWVGRRRWNAGTGWTEVGPDVPIATAVPAAAAGPRLSGNPYAPHPTPTTTVTRPAPGVTLGVLLLVCSAVAMMVGSVTTWIATSSSSGGVSLFGGTAGLSSAFSAAVPGNADGMSTLIGINGYITLIAATVVLVFAGLIAVSNDTSVRIIALVFALVSLGLSIYAVVRVAEKLSATHTPRGVTLSVGWGVILTLGAAAVATLITLFEVTRNR